LTFKTQIPGGLYHVAYMQCIDVAYCYSVASLCLPVGHDGEPYVAVLFQMWTRVVPKNQMSFGKGHF